MKNARRPCALESEVGETGSRRLEVVNRPVAELRLDAKNPRRHERRQIEEIARSIAAFGFNVPVLIDGADNVVAGHGRVLACRELGLAEVPTIRLDHLSATRARAFMIADNRACQQGYNRNISRRPRWPVPITGWSIPTFVPFRLEASAKIQVLRLKQLYASVFRLTHQG